ncbi:lipopolysaccharide biosynthesis protein [Candidatus Halobeggiatoa sp. HSG11]|nr:lipopolysaccharide biosynthesis protein [Candidatus Halobeggiatoa sp. HSG11]
MKQWFNNRFVHNVGWIGLSEMMARVSRLLTAIVLARYLSLEEFGIAALVMTTDELIKVFNQNGIGAKIIHTSKQHLEAVCNTAYRLNWFVCITLFLLQSLAAFPIAWFYQQPQLVEMVMLLAIVYLLMPLGLVQAFLIQRENRFKVIALVAGVQVTVDNLLTAGLAIAGFGVWAIVLPKLLVAPIWVIGMRMNYSWKFKLGTGFAHWQEILHFGKHILGVELLKTLRLNLDNLIIGRFLGIEALGIYYFARNAGLGISLSLTRAFNTALFPHLCEVQHDRNLLREKFLNTLKIVSLSMIPLILAQALLAPWYVPIVFGEKWIVAIPVLVLLCLSAIPRPYGEGASEVMRVLNKPHIDFYWSLLFTVFFFIGLLAALPWGITGVAVAILLIHLLALPAYTGWVIRKQLF